MSSVLYRFMFQLSLWWFSFHRWFICLVSAKISGHQKDSAALGLWVQPLSSKRKRKFVITFQGSSVGTKVIDVCLWSYLYSIMQRGCVSHWVVAGGLLFHKHTTQINPTHYWNHSIPQTSTFYKVQTHICFKADPWVSFNSYFNLAPSDSHT